MKKFRFRLQALLQLRRMQEDAALGDLAKLTTQYNQEHMKALEKEKLLREGPKPDHHSGGADRPRRLDLSEKTMWSRYYRLLQTQLRESQKKLAQISPMLEKEKGKLLEARRKRKVLELLREKQQAQYQLQIRKEQKKELAEINQQKQAQVFNVRHSGKA